MGDDAQKKSEKMNGKNKKSFLFLEMFFLVGFAILMLLILVFGERSPVILYEDDLDKFLNTEDIKNVTVRFKNNIANIEGVAIDKNKKEYNFEVNLDIHRFNKSFDVKGIKHESYHECFKTAVEKAKKKYNITTLNSGYKKKDKQFFFSIDRHQKTANPVLVLFDMLLGFFLQIVIHVLIYFAIFSLGIYFLKKFSKKSGGILSGPNLFGDRMPIINKEEQQKITFKDIAGYEVIKKEIFMLVSYFKNPEKFKKMGAKIPRGFLLYGPPGTGKTLLIKALAGEAGVPVYCISMTEIYSQYVSVASQTIRNIFALAAKNAPSIIAIDEIDMIGQKNNHNFSGNEACNQFLTELDGIRKNSGVVLFGTTNRIEMIDKSLLRSGRFDMKIEFYLPIKEDRKKIFELVCRNKPIDKNIDFQLLSRITYGCSGADISNIINTAAIMAAEQNKIVITFEMIETAIDKIFVGLSYLEKTKEEIKRIAIHESSHAVVALLNSKNKTVEKINIVPKGRTGGYTLIVPKDEMSLLTKQDLLDNITEFLAGREGEKLFLSDESSGGNSDIQEATRIAYTMIRELGMSSQLAPIRYQQKNIFSNINYPSTSEQTDYLIDQEVTKIIKKQEMVAKNIITKNKKIIKQLADSLIKNNVLHSEEIKKIVFGDSYLTNENISTKIK